MKNKKREMVNEDNNELLWVIGLLGTLLIIGSCTFSIMENISIFDGPIYMIVFGIVILLLGLMNTYPDKIHWIGVIFNTVFATLFVSLALYIKDRLSLWVFGIIFVILAIGSLFVALNITKDPKWINKFIKKKKHRLIKISDTEKKFIIYKTSVMGTSLVITFLLFYITICLLLFNRTGINYIYLFILLLPLDLGLINFSIFSVKHLVEDEDKVKYDNNLSIIITFMVIMILLSICLLMIMLSIYFTYFSYFYKQNVFIYLVICLVSFIWLSYLTYDCYFKKKKKRKKTRKH